MPQKISPPSVNQTAVGNDDIQIVGSNNVITRITNFFAGDTEAQRDQRTRRILLNHVENFWVKGILEKSLHGVALLELGIKEDPHAVHYPWAIRRESAPETLPAGTTMLEIFEQIGLGRSLLILGAPGAGKTTMLLELARLLIERARQDAAEPIPMVFNLSSWTEKQSLADWLAAELNAGYTVSKKHAPKLIEGDKLLLLLDGLDEVRPESRAKCVEAINQFRKEHGLTCVAACSRSQEYADLNARLAFDGAIEIQPLTAGQVEAYFERFGGKLAGIRQALQSDPVLQEMAETPLFLSIMTLAYQNQQATGILVSASAEEQRKHIFDTYIDRMFERPGRAQTERFSRPDVLRWLSWLASKMIEYNQSPYLLERMQPDWLPEVGKHRLTTRWGYNQAGTIIFGLIIGLIVGLIGRLIAGSLFGLMIGLSCGLSGGLIGWSLFHLSINTVDSFTWNWRVTATRLSEWLFGGLIFALTIWLGGMISILGEPIGELMRNLKRWFEDWYYLWLYGIIVGLIVVLIAGFGFGLILGLDMGFHVREVAWITFPGQRLYLSKRNSFIFLISWLIFGLIDGLFAWLILTGKLFDWVIAGLIFGLVFGLVFGLRFGGFTIIQHYTLRILLNISNLLPWKLIPFLDYCTDLVFLRRVGGGYIFIHRMLMEHFADMCPADEK